MHEHNLVPGIVESRLRHTNLDESVVDSFGGLAHPDVVEAQLAVLGPPLSVVFDGLCGRPPDQDGLLLSFELIEDSLMGARLRVSEWGKV